MKVAILATYFAPDLGGGVARYEREVLPRLIPALIAAGCEVWVMVLKDAGPLDPAKGLHLVRLPVGRGQPLKRILYNQIGASRLSRGVDVLLSLEYWLPLIGLRSKRNIVVMHDAHAEIAWRGRRGRMPNRQFPSMFYWHSAYTRAARAADRILTDSHFAAGELHRVFGIPNEKIAAVYCGVDLRHMCPMLDRESRERVRKRYALPESYYLFVGPASGDKNLRLILEAYLGLASGDSRALPVAVTSDRPARTPEARLLEQLEASGKGGLVHFTGHVDRGDLPVVYSAATALIFPSLHEGFGLPPLEAMACGTPVLASNRTSVPEVVGDAAIHFDAADPRTLLEALDKIQDESLRRDLIAKGAERVKMFSWDRTVRQIVEEVISEGRKGATASQA